MRKWLLIILILALGVVAALWWLGQSLEQSKPQPGEVRTEIEHVF